MKDETTSGPCRAGFYCVTACTKPTPNNPLPLFSTIFTTISTTPLNVSTNSGNAIENLESTLSMGVWTSTAGGICPTGSIVRLELVPLNNVILDTSYHTRAQLLKLNVYYVLLDFIALQLVSLIHMTQ